MPKPKHTLTLPQIDVLERWFGLVPSQRTDLLEAGHFLLVGPGLAQTLQLPQPSYDALLEHARLVRDNAPELLGDLRPILQDSGDGRDVLLDLAVDELLAAPADAWEHPSQVLERPRPAYADLVPFSERRLASFEGAKLDHANVVHGKLEKAAAIAESARRRREIMARGRRRRPRGS
jgi:hypothetical protein